jgi:hypothetical protein
MIIGGMIGWFLGTGESALGWKVQLGLFLVPTLIYGIMFFGQRFPQSEASEKGLSLGGMFKDVGLLGGAVVAFMLYLFFNSTLAPFFEESPENAFYISIAIGLLTLGLIGKITNFAVGHWLIFVLFITHALVGAVELGTDGWMQNILGAILSKAAAWRSSLFLPPGVPR